MNIFVIFFENVPKKTKIRTNLFYSHSFYYFQGVKKPILFPDPEPALYL